MDVMEIIDNLEDAVDKAISVPFSGKSLIDKEELLDLISDMRLKLPEDLKQAKWVKEERQRIILEAQKEANTIIKSAEDKLAALISEHEVTQKANGKANEIISAAQQTAREIRLGTRQYADGILGGIEQMLNESKNSIIRSMNDVSKSVGEVDRILDIVNENRQELKK